MGGENKCTLDGRKYGIHNYKMKAFFFFFKHQPAMAIKYKLLIFRVKKKKNNLEVV